MLLLDTSVYHQIHMYVCCVYVCLYFYVCVFDCVYMCCVCMCVGMWVCVCVCVYIVYVCACMYV